MNLYSSQDAEKKKEKKEVICPPWPYGQNCSNRVDVMSPKFTGIIKKAVIWDLNNSLLIIPSVYYLGNGWCKKLQSKISFNQALSLYYSTHSRSHMTISFSLSELLPFVQQAFQKWSNAEA